MAVLPWTLAFMGLEIVPIPTLERSRKTGRIVAPDGTTREAKGWFWRSPDKFIEYEESDLQWLLPLNIVRWEREAVVLVIDDKKLEKFRAGNFKFEREWTISRMGSFDAIKHATT